MSLKVQISFYRDERLNFTIFSGRIVRLIIHKLTKLHLPNLLEKKTKQSII